MGRILDIYEAISVDGFTESTLQAIDKHVNDIQNGTEDFSRFDLSEHAGLCTAGAPLIGAAIIASYATASLAASCDAEGCQGSPANWEIDERQEQLIEQWAKASNLWVEDSEQILTETFGAMIAQGVQDDSFVFI